MSRATRSITPNRSLQGNVSLAGVCWELLPTDTAAGTPPPEVTSPRPPKLTAIGEKALRARLTSMQAVARVGQRRLANA